MNYRRLGRTGLKVSEIGLGSWLTFGGTVAEETAKTCVWAAFEAGVNFFDTADAYAGGKAEEVLGRSIRDLPRAELVIATKVFFRMWPGPNGRGLSRKHIMESAEHSLRRLGLDYIDLYQTHTVDPETPIDETLRALDDLIGQGKVLYAGCSNYNAAQLAEALLAAERDGVTRFDSLQPEYSMLARGIEAEDLPFCQRHGMGVVCYSPLAEGVLTGKYASPARPPKGSRLAGKRQSPYLTRENLARVRRLRPIAARHRCTLAQLALAWVLRRPEVTSAIIGASRPEQVVENVKAVDLKPTPQDLDAIDAALR
jgi:aryl-alcohol dehydrogenase-like predicted oxidoreductase